MSSVAPIVNFGLSDCCFDPVENESTDSDLGFYGLVFTVVLPPEKAEGCESYLQYLHSEDGEREILRDATKASGKKRISLDVSSLHFDRLQMDRSEFDYQAEPVV